MSLLIKALRKGSRQIQKMELRADQELVIGRSTQELGLERDPRLSRQHFKLQYTGDEIVVTHLSKTNPTLIADEGVEEFRPVTGECSVKVNCRIIAGSYRFQLELVRAIQEDSFDQLTGDANDVSQPAVVSEPLNKIDSRLAEGDWRSSECHLGEVPDYFNEESASEPQTKRTSNSKTIVFGEGSNADQMEPGGSGLRRTFNDTAPKKPVERLQLTPPKKQVEVDLNDAAPEVQQPQKTNQAGDRIVFPIDDDFFD